MAEVESQVLIKKVDRLVDIAIENQGLINYLRGCDHWKERWETLEQYIFKRLADSGLNIDHWNYPDIRNQFFYKIQQRMNMDFGFCPKFEPAYAERLDYFLNEEKTNPEYNRDLCKLNGTTIPTTCNGTDREHCVHYRKRLKH